MEVGVSVVTEGHWYWIERIGEIENRSDVVSVRRAGLGRCGEHDPVTRCLNTSRSSKEAVVVSLSNTPV